MSGRPRVFETETRAIDPKLFHGSYVLHIQVRGEAKERLGIVTGQEALRARST